MSYIERIKELVRTEVLAADEECPKELIDLYVLLALTRGAATTSADVHCAWALWRSGFEPGHPSIVPFQELSFEVQDLDRPYRDAIQRASIYFSRER